MKKLLLLLLALPLFAGCEYFEEWFGKASEPDPEPKPVPQGIHISVVPDVCSYDEAMTRLVVMDPTSCLVEMVDPAASNVVTMCFWSASESNPVLVSVVGEQVLFMNYNPCHDENLPAKVLAAYRAEDAIILKECTLDSQSQVITPTGEEYRVPVLNSDVRSYSDDDYDEEIRGIFYNFLNDLDAGIGKIGDAVDNLPSSKAAKAVCRVWSKFAIPIAKMQLYSDDPEMLAQIQEEYLSGEIQGWVDSQIDNIVSFFVPEEYEEYVPIAEKGWMAFLYGAENYNPAYSDEEVARYMSPEELSVFNRRSTYASMQASSMRSEVGIPYDKYQVSAYVREVGEDSARVSGGFDCVDGQQGYISEMGFYYWSKFEPERVVTVPDLYAGVELNNLLPGTQYYVVAYLRSMGEEYQSSPVTFLTDFSFEVSPSELSFTAAGGVKGVAVQVVDPDAEWKIVRSPDWCRIERGEATFFVTVEAATESRSGEIVVACTTSAGVIYERSVSVSQTASQWNYTTWSLSGTTSAQGESQPVSFTLKIGDVAKGEVSIGAEGEGFQSSASLDEHGDLIYKMNYSYSTGEVSAKADATFRFMRVDPTNLRWSMDYTSKATINVGGQSVSESITGTGSGTGILAQ